MQNIKERSERLKQKISEDYSNSMRKRELNYSRSLEKYRQKIEEKEKEDTEKRFKKYESYVI